jgi:hypothetical protein
VSLGASIVGTVGSGVAVVGNAIQQNVETKITEADLERIIESNEVPGGAVVTVKDCDGNETKITGKASLPELDEGKEYVAKAGKIVCEEDIDSISLSASVSGQAITFTGQAGRQVEYKLVMASSMQGSIAISNTGTGTTGNLGSGDYTYKYAGATDWKLTAVTILPARVEAPAGPPETLVDVEPVVPVPPSETSVDPLTESGAIPPENPEGEQPLEAPVEAGEGDNPEEIPTPVPPLADPEVPPASETPANAKTAVGTYGSVNWTSDNAGCKGLAETLVNTGIISNDNHGGGLRPWFDPAVACGGTLETTARGLWVLLQNNNPILVTHKYYADNIEGKSNSAFTCPTTDWKKHCPPGFVNPAPATRAPAPAPAAREPGCTLTTQLANGRVEDRGTTTTLEREGADCTQAKIDDYKKISTAVGRDWLRLVVNGKKYYVMKNIEHTGDKFNPSPSAWTIHNGEWDGATATIQAESTPGPWDWDSHRPAAAPSTVRPSGVGTQEGGGTLITGCTSCSYSGITWTNDETGCRELASGVTIGYLNDTEAQRTANNTLAEKCGGGLKTKYETFRGAALLVKRKVDSQELMVSVSHYNGSKSFAPKNVYTCEGLNNWKKPYCPKELDGGGTKELPPSTSHYAFITRGVAFMSGAEGTPEKTKLEKQQGVNKAGRVMTLVGNIAGTAGGAVTVGFSINAADKAGKLVKQVKACQASFKD